MPIGLSPRATIPVYLDGDLADEPDKEKAQHFLTKFPSCEDSLTNDPLVNEAHKLVGDPEADQGKINDLINRVLTSRIVSTVNMPPNAPPFAEMLDKVLTPAEKWELLYKTLSATRLAESDRKKSGSAQQSSTAGSAPIAATAATA